MKKPSLLVVFLTVFIDLIGFGIVLPLLPLYGEHFGATGWINGCIMASFSLMQFVFAPFWGRLSDRLGRRPILLLSTAGAAGSYAVFALGSNLEGQTALIVILISRVLAGICGANITVAQAYIADVTPPESRSKRMGLIGAAFGLGFTFGPAIGGFSYDHFGLSGPGWVAAGLCAANFILAFAILGESRKPTSEPQRPRPRLQQWTEALSRPRVGVLIGIFFLATFCFTCFEMTLGLLVRRNFQLHHENAADAKTISMLFVYCGIIGALIQGGAIGRLVKLCGEPLLITLSLILVGVSLAFLPFVHSWAGLLVVLGLLAAGSGTTRPPIFGLISNLTPADQQGAVIGVAQSAGSLARIAGPVFAATLFDFRPALPYLICAGLGLLAGLLAWRSLIRSEQPLPNGVSPAGEARQ